MTDIYYDRLIDCMIDRLQDYVRSSISSSGVSNDIKILSELENKDLLLKEDFLFTEHLVSIENIEIAITKNEKIDNNKLVFALVVYERFKNKLPNILALKNFLYCVEFLIGYYLRNFYNTLEQPEIILETFFHVEIRKAIFNFKNSVILSKKKKIDEKILMINYFQDWIMEYSNNSPDDCEYLNIMYEYLRILNTIKSIIKLLKELNSKDQIDEVKILKIKSKFNIFFQSRHLESQKTSNFFNSLIQTLNLRPDKIEKIYQLFEEISFHHQFPKSFVLLKFVEDLFPNFYQCKLLKLDKAKKLVADFYNKFNNFIVDDVEPEYLNTKISEEPSKDLLLIKFIAATIDNYEDLHIRMASSFTLRQTLKEIFSLDAIAKNILKMPEHQTLVLEMLLQGMMSDPSKTYDLISLNFLHGEPKIKELPSEYKTEFLKRCLKNPFRKVLTQFMPKISPELEECLSEMLERTYVLAMPSNICGMTLIRRSILLQKYPEGVCAKAATFYVYLHEAAHYLQRVNESLFNGSTRPLSPGVTLDLDLNEDSDEDYGQWSNREILNKLSLIKEVFRKENIEKGKNEEKQSIEENEAEKKKFTIVKSEENEKKILLVENQELKLNQDQIIGKNKEYSSLIKDELKEQIHKYEEEKDLETKLSEDLNKKPASIDGGKILEVALFGQQYQIISATGAEYLMSNLENISLPQFRYEFNKKNQLQNGPFQLLKSRDGIELGKCPGLGYLQIFKK